MLPAYKTKTNIGIGIGILVQFLARGLMSDPSTASIGLVVGIAGAVFFIWGCMNYAQGKGYSMWLGLLGLLSCLGLIVLVVLPDKHK